jgi:hypothetical protein
MLLLIILYLLYLLSTQCRGYLWFLPSRPWKFPNSPSELEQVKDAVKSRTLKDEAFHRLTDRSVGDAFVLILGPRGHSIQEIDDVARSQNTQIMMHKLWNNRPRPAQLDPDLGVLHSDTAHTPAYPAGHAWQARIVANHYSKIHPDLASDLSQMAEECRLTRVKAGLHYPSD